MIFIFHFHNIFVVTYYANISVMDTLIHVGRIKMLHKHTHLPLCVLTACGHWTPFLYILELLSIFFLDTFIYEDSWKTQKPSSRILRKRILFNI